MKKQIRTMLTVAMLFAATIINAQAPEGFNYQAVVRDGSGNLITSGTVNLEFIIRNGTASGTTVYQETQNATPNQYGLVTAVIGSGTVTSGTIASIAWGNNKHFIETKVNGASISNTQFQSVPYAIASTNATNAINATNATTAATATNADSAAYATSAATATTSLDNQWTKSGNNISNANSGNVGIGNNAPQEKLDVNGEIRLSGGQQRIYGSGSQQNHIRFVSNNHTFVSGASFVSLQTGSTERVRVLQSGNVGIGTTTPDAPLTVGGTGITTPTLARRYFNAGSPLTADNSSSANIRIHSLGAIWAQGEFVSTSDRRIKNVIGITDSKKDLSVLNKIEITDYKFIDEIDNNDRNHKKVIAQQVESVYPDAVLVNKGIVPNVYAVAEKVTSKNTETIISTKKPHTFENGDEVKLIMEKSGEKIVCVNVINEHQFSVDEQLNGNVFVYGKKVNDLRMVDYDALTTLNISATQEMYKMIIDLKAENAALKTELSNSNSATSSLKADVDAIKAQLGTPSGLSVR